MLGETSFYTEEELPLLRLASYGRDVRISRKTSFYAPEQMHLGSHVRIDDFCILSSNIRIGNHVHIAAYCGLFGSEGIMMDDYTAISAGGLIYSASDDYVGQGMTNPTVPDGLRVLAKGPVILQKHVIIGAGSIIFPNVTIGTGTAVGSLSLVNRDCAPWKVYAGTPVKMIKSRRRDIILNYQKRLEDEENEG
jgi:dTDP-4-amino-4,6-dideoxy-D-glucose acyltransferase